MAGMTKAEINKARRAMEEISTPSVTAKEISSSGVLLTVYTPKGSITVSKGYADDDFTVVESMPLHGEFTYSMPAITEFDLGGGAVETTESQAEMVLALIAKGITFPLVTAEVG